MNQANQEALSAAADGELSREELRFLLRRLDHDTELAEAWSRLHVGSDALRRQTPLRLASAGFAERVMAGLDVAPAVATVARRRHWLHWSAGGAIAAGVAVAALMVAQPAGRQVDSAPLASTTPTQASPRDAALADVGSSPAAAPQWLAGNNASRLTQQAAFGGLSRTMSYPPQPMPYQVQPVQVNGDASANDGRYLILLTPPTSEAANVQPAVRAR
jgi:sigma-E factor negative regulatory protein RseA